MFGKILAWFSLFAITAVLIPVNCYCLFKYIQYGHVSIIKKRYTRYAVTIVIGLSLLCVSRVTLIGFTLFVDVHSVLFEINLIFSGIITYAFIAGLLFRNWHLYADYRYTYAHEYVDANPTNRKRKWSSIIRPERTEGGSNKPHVIEKRNWRTYIERDYLNRCMGIRQDRKNNAGRTNITNTLTDGFDRLTGRKTTIHTSPSNTFANDWVFSDNFWVDNRHTYGSHLWTWTHIFLSMWGALSLFMAIITFFGGMDIAWIVSIIIVGVSLFIGIVQWLYLPGGREAFYDALKIKAEATHLARIVSILFCFGGMTFIINLSIGFVLWFFALQNLIYACLATIASYFVTYVIYLNIY